MSRRNLNGAYLLLANAILWAAAMIGGSFVFKGAAWSEDLTLWMIAGFFTANGLILASLSRRSKRDGE